MSVHNKLTYEEILRRFRKIHGDKYDYDEDSYVDTHTKMRMYCHEKYSDGIEHGWFEKSPHKHISQKQGCPYCTHKKHTIETMKHAIKLVHGDKYDLTNINSYTNNREYIYPICHCKDDNGDEHGQFRVTVHNLIKGRGCPKCALVERHNKRTRTTEEFINEAKQIHGGKYDYSITEYNVIHDKLRIICHEKDCNGNEHGEFWQSADIHLRGSGCPKCGKTISRPEIDISDYIENTLGIDIIRNERKILEDGKELDIYIPSMKIAFEFDGMIWHSEKYKVGHNYHLDKTNKCLSKGIKLYHIYQSEYDTNRELVLSKISSILGKSHSIRIGARKCIVREIDKTNAKDFLSKNHIQGYVASTVYIGGYYNDELVGVMTFKKSGLYWELTRFATNSKYICQGLGSKLFKYFTINYEYEEVKSFADRRWTVDEKDNLYVKLGFKLEKVTKPDYAYTNNHGEYFHKFNFRKQILHNKYGFPLSMTESEMTKEIGFYKIWNCGLLKYVYRKRDS